MSTNPFEDDNARYVILVNAENQHSLWPETVAVPDGWTVAHPSDTRQNCLAYVEENWTDIRPASLVVDRVAQQRETAPGGARAQDPPGLDVLTARELEVLRLVARGYSNHGIGHELHISACTVSIHVSHILAKLKATNRTEAAGRLSYRELISVYRT